MRTTCDDYTIIVKSCVEEQREEKSFKDLRF